MRRPDPGRQVDVGIFHAREGSDAGKRPEALYSTADVASGCLHRRGGRVVGLLFLTSREGCDRRLQRCGAVDVAAQDVERQKRDERDRSDQLLGVLALQVMSSSDVPHLVRQDHRQLLGGVDEEKERDADVDRAVRESEPVVLRHREHAYPELVRPGRHGSLDGCEDGVDVRGGGMVLREAVGSECLLGLIGVPLQAVLRRARRDPAETGD